MPHILNHTILLVITLVSWPMTAWCQTQPYVFSRIYAQSPNQGDDDAKAMAQRQAWALLVWENDFDEFDGGAGTDDDYSDDHALASMTTYFHPTLGGAYGSVEATATAEVSLAPNNQVLCECTGLHQIPWWVTSCGWSDVYGYHGTRLWCPDSHTWTIDDPATDVCDPPTTTEILVEGEVSVLWANIFAGTPPTTDIVASFSVMVDNVTVMQLGIHNGEVSYFTNYGLFGPDPDEDSDYFFLDPDGDSITVSFSYWVVEGSVVRVSYDTSVSVETDLEFIDGSPASTNGTADLEFILTQELQ